MISAIDFNVEFTMNRNYFAVTISIRDKFNPLDNIEHLKNNELSKLHECSGEQITIQIKQKYITNATKTFRKKKYRI